MKQFENQFFNLLVKKYNFYIKYYFSSYKNTNTWIAISERENFAYCVIVCDENEANAVYYETYKTLQNIMLKPIILNVVIAIDNCACDISFLGEYNKLIYSLNEKKVVYSVEGCKPLVQVLNCLNTKEKTKSVRKNNSTITYTIIAVNIIIFIITAMLSNSIFEIDSYVLLEMGAKVNYLIDNGQAWRLVSATFLHGGIIHLVFNMYALNSLGSQVEYVYGRIKYLLIYFISGLSGSIFSYIFSAYSISVGASGAIFGLLGAMLVFGYKHKNKIGKGYMMNIVQVIILNLVIGVTMSNIDNSAHLGGLIAGGVTAMITDRKLMENN